MIIRWKTDSLLVTPLKDKINSETLFPGYNFIEDKIYKEIANDLKRYVDQGRMEILGEIKTVKQNNKNVTKVYSKDLKDFEGNKAIEIVKNCNNRKTLEKWKKEDSRDEVRIAIKEKIDDIKNG